MDKTHKTHWTVIKPDHRGPKQTHMWVIDKEGTWDLVPIKIRPRKKRSDAARAKRGGNS